MTLNKARSSKRGCRRSHQPAAVEHEHRAITGELMKRVTSILTGLSLAVLCFVASAHAQYSEERATANIPFEFTIGNLSFPAGQYDFIRTGSGAYVVRDADGRGLMVLTAAQVQVDGLPEKSMLKFAVVNGRHVLVQIWYGYTAIGNEFQHPTTIVEPSKLRSYR